MQYKLGISALVAGKPCCTKLEYQLSRDQTDVVEACHLKACKGGPEEEG